MRTIQMPSAHMISAPIKVNRAEGIAEIQKFINMCPGKVILIEIALVIYNQYGRNTPVITQQSDGIRINTDKLTDQDINNIVNIIRQNK